MYSKSLLSARDDYTTNSAQFVVIKSTCVLPPVGCWRHAPNWSSSTCRFALTWPLTWWTDWESSFLALTSRRASVEGSRSLFVVVCRQSRMSTTTVSIVIVEFLKQLYRMINHIMIVIVLCILYRCIVYLLYGSNISVCYNNVSVNCCCNPIHPIGYSLKKQKPCSKV